MSLLLFAKINKHTFPTSVFNGTHGTSLSRPAHHSVTDWQTDAQVNGQTENRSLCVSWLRQATQKVCLQYCLLQTLHI